MRQSFRPRLVARPLFSDPTYRVPMLLLILTAVTEWPHLFVFTGFFEHGAVALPGSNNITDCALCTTNWFYMPI